MGDDVLVAATGFGVSLDDGLATLEAENCAEVAVSAASGSDGAGRFPERAQRLAVVGLHGGSQFGIADPHGLSMANLRGCHKQNATAEFHKHASFQRL